MNKKETEILRSFSTTDHISSPKRTFEINEEVYIEGAISAVVKDILFDGKFLEVEFITPQAKPSDISQENLTSDWNEMVADAFGISDLPEYKFFEAGEKMVDFFPWFQVYKLDTDPGRYLFDRQMKIKAYITTVRNLLNKVYFSGVNFEPDYQRGLVWDLEDKQKLIQSIRDGGNIGLFVFATLRSDPNEGPCFEVTDGKQRLSTLKEYFEDGFEVGGLYFSELHPADRKNFLDHTVEMVNLGQNAGSNRKFILKSFLILNRAGKRISEEHMAYVEKLYEEAEEYVPDKFIVKRIDSNE